MPDAIFADPRLADLYDVVDDDRSDLDAYANIVDELDATTVLDVGCGTGTLACRLAQRGVEVTGVDPATASLKVARQKWLSCCFRGFMRRAIGRVGVGSSRLGRAGRGR